MPGKLTLHPPRRAARFLLIRDGETLEIGRDPLCGLVLEDPRVSKRHARLRWTGSGWVLEDRGSRNGTAVNGEPARGSAELRDGDWVSFGGLLGRFERISAVQAANLDSERLARLQTSAEMRRRLSAGLEPVDLLLRLLESGMELTRSERGFVLVVGADGKLRAELASGFSAVALRDQRFGGSVGAVRRVLDSGEATVLSDVRADPSLGRRPSVVAHGIASLACVPIRHEGKVLGVIYLDSRKPGPGFTQSDLDVLEALADRTGTILAGSRHDRPFRGPSPPGDAELIAQLQQRLDELLPAV
ncbi:MAG TPA: GAF domain-containing protein [Vicinamibacteria bacterium]|nr:GAF domain-containing protein [Vicinamibacteria bacterium]